MIKYLIVLKMSKDYSSEARTGVEVSIRRPRPQVSNGGCYKGRAAYICAHFSLNLSQPRRAMLQSLHLNTPFPDSSDRVGAEIKTCFD